jgi:bla regulator protein blaR1
VVLGVWCFRWRRTSAALRGATPMLAGREVDALRRLERVASIRKRIEVVLSPSSLEPGIFGVLHPKLVWPAGISDRLGDAHLESILAHEVWHVRRRDNLAAATHMVVEAIFWFHPLVWWLGGRLMEERERACDEEVLRLGGQPQVYAESILKACEFCVASPLACVSGVSGADLKKRMVRIMTEGVRGKLDVQKKLLLAAAAFLAVAAPIGFGLAHGQAGQASGPQNAASSSAENTLATAAKFEVASIKRYKPSGLYKPSGPGMMFRFMNSSRDGRVYATGLTVKLLLQNAYHVQESQIVGGPGWINSEQFDIQAKADGSVDDDLKKLSEDQARLVKEHMLQDLLADRFGLKLHHETRELPVYALVVAKNGPKLEEAKDDAGPGRGGPGGGGLGGPEGNRVAGNRGVMMRMGGGEQQLTFNGSPLSFFAEVLSRPLGRTVIDKTGLKGRYNFNLHWVPDIAKGEMMGGPGPVGPGPVVAVAGPGGNEPSAPGAPSAPDSSGPSIFTALQEQIGLKLQSEKGPVDVLVIDHVEEPSEN